MKRTYPRPKNIGVALTLLGALAESRKYDADRISLVVRRDLNRCREYAITAGCATYYTDDDGMRDLARLLTEARKL